ncbi:MAG: PKD domain-containing protein [Bacteroidetes bacterium]|nr:PKD domain-containing protein [Bacteroidota bacterium]MBU1719781.1 PKD domain-containing protein [Bacteroidota bacterium]
MLLILRKITVVWSLLAGIFLFSGGYAQCPEYYDGGGTLSANPYWIHCTGGDYTIFVQSDQAIGPYTIDWGDGSPPDAGAGFAPPAFVGHTYTDVVDTFVVTITETSSGCITTGVVVMEHTPSASIQIPLGDPVYGCTPASFNYENASTNVSATTVFVWTFGDGSPAEIYDYTNLGQIVSHTYLPNTTDCNVSITLTAENYCNNGTPSTNVYSPIQVWDIDEAEVDPSATLLCYPDTVVSYTNTTLRNCFGLGNNSQRYEYWNFGNYWGMGHDSILGWRPWGPPNYGAIPIAYPGIGSYDMMFIDSSFCGLDTFYLTIQIVPPPVAGLTASDDTICTGQSITFTNTTTGPANSFIWNFGDGTIVTTNNTNPRTHTYVAPGDYTVTLTADIAGGQGCSDMASIPVVVLPGPTADFTFDNDNLCDSMYVTFVDASTSAVTWAWNFGNGNTFNAQSPPVQFYPAPGSYTVTLNVTESNGCSDSESKTIRVRPTPIAGFSANNVCVGQTATFIDTSYISAGLLTSWAWSFGDGNSSTQQNPSHVYLVPDSLIVTLVVSSAYCSDSAQMLVIAGPLPAPDFIPDISSGCPPVTVSFANNNVSGAIAHLWDFGDGGSSSIQNPVHVFNNPYGVDTSYKVMLTVITNFGCIDSVSKYITVFTAPNAAYSSDAVPACSPVDVNFTSSSVGASGYLWDFGDGTTSTQQNPSHTFENDTTFIKYYLVKLAINSPNGCTDTASAYITVYPNPTYDFEIIPDSVCHPASVLLSATPGGFNYWWAYGDGTSGPGGSNAWHAYSNTAVSQDSVYTVKLVTTSFFACVDSVEYDLVVHPKPIASFVLDTIIGCTPFEAGFTNISTGADTYYWDFGDSEFDTTASAAAFTHIYENLLGTPINTTVKLTAENASGCIDEISRMITVYPAVNAEFAADTEGCSPYVVNFLNQTTGANFYLWDFGDGFTSASIHPSHTFYNFGVNDTVFQVMLISYSPFFCSDTATISITVHPKPDAIISIDQVTGCTPFIVTTINQSIGGNTFSWNFGDGNSATGGAADTIIHTYTNSISTPVQNLLTFVAETPFGCRDSSSVIITVYPEVVAGFSADTAGCSPFPVQFTNISSGSISYLWDFGDGNLSVAGSPAHVYSNSSGMTQNRNSCLIATSQYGCADTACRQISVYPKPQALFNLDQTEGCTPFTAVIHNQTTAVSNFDWTFGDGQSSSSAAATLTHQYLNSTSTPNNYLITLIVRNAQGCYDTSFTTVRVFPPVQSAFSCDTAGCAPLFVSFVNQSLGAQGYSWSFGDGNTSAMEEPINIFENNSINDTIFPVSLSAVSQYGCTAVFVRNIHVYPSPDAAFVASPAQQNYPDATVSISNNTNPGNWTFHWSFADGSTDITSDPPDHTYATWGDYIIRMSATGTHCADSTEQMVQIFPPLPIADYGSSKSGCEPLTVDFENFSQYGYSFYWNFGDGNYSALENPTYTYYQPGDYDVVLIVSGPGGVDTATGVHITVFVSPQAYFNADPMLVYLPDEPVYFHNLSENQDFNHWEFGDGTESTEENPNHIYTDEGLYIVSLEVSTMMGCKDTYILQTGIQAIEEGEIEFPNAFTPDPSGSNGGRYTAGEFTNDVFYPVYKGVEEYELNIFNRWGELIFESDDVLVGWDGYYREKLCKQDVYVWKVRAKFSNGKTVTKTGDLTLIR